MKHDLGDCKSQIITPTTIRESEVENVDCFAGGVYGGSNSYGFSDSRRCSKIPVTVNLDSEVIGGVVREAGKTVARRIVNGGVGDMDGVLLSTHQVGVSRVDVEAAATYRSRSIRRSSATTCI